MTDIDTNTPATERERRLATLLITKQPHAVLRELIDYLGNAGRQRGLSPLEVRIAEACRCRLRHEFTDHS